MADGAITSVSIEDDTVPTFRVARLHGERFRNSAIANTIRHKFVVVGYAAQGECYQHCSEQTEPRRAEPAQAKASAVMLAYHDWAYSASRCRISLGASTGLMPSEPSTAAILSPTT